LKKSYSLTDLVFAPENEDTDASKFDDNVNDNEQFLQLQRRALPQITDITGMFSYKPTSKIPDKKEYKYSFLYDVYPNTIFLHDR
jgi:hypothetical protein